MLNPRSERKALDALDLADVLASMGVVTSSDSSTTCSYPLVHFRPQQHVAPPHNPFALDPSLVFRRASEPTPPIHALPPVHGLWRAATDGHVDPSLVDTSFIRNAGASGVWQNTTNTRVEPNVVNTSVFLQNASGITAHQLQQEGPRLTRRDVYSFSRLSTVFHLPQHKACSELRRRMEAEGLVGYRLSSLKLLIKCYDLQRWPYRKVHAHLRHLAKAVSGLQAREGDPTARAELRLQAASTIQQLCELYRVRQASMVPKELVEFHELRTQFDALQHE